MKRQADEIDDRLLKPLEVCKLLGVSKCFIYEHVKHLPHYRVGSELRFLRSELLEHFKAMRTQGAR